MSRSDQFSAHAASFCCVATGRDQRRQLGVLTFSKRRSVKNTGRLAIARENARVGGADRARTRFPSVNALSGFSHDQGHSRRRPPRPGSHSCVTHELPCVRLVVRQTRAPIFRAETRSEGEILRSSACLNLQPRPFAKVRPASRMSSESASFKIRGGRVARRKERVAPRATPPAGAERNPVAAHRT
jgi:hypothetical protein